MSSESPSYAIQNSLHPFWQRAYYSEGVNKNPNKSSGQNQPKPATTIKPTAPQVPDETGENKLKQAVHWLDRNRAMTILTLFILGTYITGNIFSCRQLNMTERTFRADQRPWVKVTLDAAAFQVAGPVGGKIHLANVGKTPARPSNIAFCVELVPNGKEPSLSYPQEKCNHTVLGTMYPNVVEDFDVAMIDWNKAGIWPPYNLTQQDFDSIKEHRAFVIVYGKVEYTDFFKIDHWTHFCEWMTVSGQTGIGITAANCTKYNDVDNN